MVCISTSHVSSAYFSQQTCCGHVSARWARVLYLGTGPATDDTDQPHHEADLIDAVSASQRDLTSLNVFESSDRPMLALAGFRLNIDKVVAA